MLWCVVCCLDSSCLMFNNAAAGSLAARVAARPAACHMSSCNVTRTQQAAAGCIALCVVLSSARISPWQQELAAPCCMRLRAACRMPHTYYVWHLTFSAVRHGMSLLDSGPNRAHRSSAYLHGCITACLMPCSAAAFAFFFMHGCTGFLGAAARHC